MAPKSGPGPHLPAWRLPPPAVRAHFTDRVSGAGEARRPELRGSVLTSLSGPLFGLWENSLLGWGCLRLHGSGAPTRVPETREGLSHPCSPTIGHAPSGQGCGPHRAAGGHTPFSPGGVRSVGFPGAALAPCPGEPVGHWPEVPGEEATPCPRSQSTDHTCAQQGSRAPWESQHPASSSFLQVPRWVGSRGRKTRGPFLNRSDRCLPGDCDFHSPFPCMQPHPQGSLWGGGGVLGEPALSCTASCPPCQRGAGHLKPPEEACRLEGLPCVRWALPAVFPAGTCSAPGEVGTGQRSGSSQLPI